MSHKTILAMLAGCLVLGAHAALADEGSGVPAESDTFITNAVKGKLSTDDPQIARNIQVETKDGVVTLRGFAFAPSAVIKAMRDAESVRGVVKVENHIQLQQ
ncbi:MAG TPA: BON domain-containing protein [Steroidobacteraceae bacterium]|nr:BON domain-containing protein [Steroidobacteraceae bacterium]